MSNREFWIVVDVEPVIDGYVGVIYANGRGWSTSEDLYISKTYEAVSSAFADAKDYYDTVMTDHLMDSVRDAFGVMA